MKDHNKPNLDKESTFISGVAGSAVIRCGEVVIINQTRLVYEQEQEFCNVGDKQDKCSSPVVLVTVPRVH